MRLLLGLNGERPSESICDNFEGVGLIRGEYLCRMHGEWITSKKCRQAISDYVIKISRAFMGKPVWYRLIDMESSEVNTMPGCGALVVEKTTMLGVRGLRRGLQFRHELEAEIAMLRDISSTYPNVHLLLPFVADASETKEAIVLARSLGFHNRIGMMAEIPSAVLTLPAMFAAGVDQVTLGMNDLTSLTLGASRESSLYQRDHPAVLALVRIAVEAANDHGVELSAAGYLSESDIEKLEDCGVRSAVIHYSNLRKIWPSKYGHVTDEVNLTAIKNIVRAKVNDPRIDG